MSDRIELNLPNGRALRGEALISTDERLVQGGDTYAFSLPVPEGVKPIRVVAILVKLDD